MNVHETPASLYDLLRRLSGLPYMTLRDQREAESKRAALETKLQQEFLKLAGSSAASK